MSFQTPVSGMPPPGLPDDSVRDTPLAEAEPLRPETATPSAAAGGADGSAGGASDRRGPLVSAGVAGGVAPIVASFIADPLSARTGLARSSAWSRFHRFRNRRRRSP